MLVIEFKIKERINMLIAICGIDGSGKTTQINLLKDYFEKQGKNIHLTKQPTNFYRNYDRFRKYVNREISPNNSNIIFELALLSAADKIRHYETDIRPNAHKIVISDRYVFSAYAYFIGRGVNDIEWLKDINIHLPIPDITIYLDIDPKIAYERIINRDGGYTKKEETDLELLSSVRNVFLKQPWGDIPNYNIIKAENRSISEIHNEIIEIIESLGVQ